jgi:hypothetical protein
MLVEHEQVFWQRVMDGNPPDPSTPEEIRLRWPTDTVLAKEATIEIVAAVDLLEQARAEVKAAEEREEEYARAVQTYMQDAGELTYLGRTLATWKQNKTGAKVDMDLMKAAYPEVVARFTKPKPGARPLLIKG